MSSIRHPCVTLMQIESVNRYQYDRLLNDCDVFVLTVGSHVVLDDKLKLKQRIVRFVKDNQIRGLTILSLSSISQKADEHTSCLYRLKHMLRKFNSSKFIE